MITEVAAKSSNTENKPPKLYNYTSSQDINKWYT